MRAGSSCKFHTHLLSEAGRLGGRIAATKSPSTHDRTLSRSVWRAERSAGWHRQFRASRAFRASRPACCHVDFASDYTSSRLTASIPTLTRGLDCYISPGPIPTHPQVVSALQEPRGPSRRREPAVLARPWSMRANYGCIPADRNPADPRPRHPETPLAVCRCAHPSHAHGHLLQ